MTDGQLISVLLVLFYLVFVFTWFFGIRYLLDRYFPEDTSLCQDGTARTDSGCPNDIYPFIF